MSCQWIRGKEFGVEECGEGPVLFEHAGSALRYCQEHAERLLNAGIRLIPVEGERAPEVEAAQEEILRGMRLAHGGRTGELIQ